jgi:gamma-glutamylcyclotransferase
MRYFAYGSNMDRAQMLKRGVNFESVEPAKLEGYALLFDKVAKANPEIGFANVSPQDGSTVEGALYTASEEEIAKLDYFEGVPKHYLREEISVTTSAGELVLAIVYIANPEKRREGLLPTPEYLEKLLAGREFLSEGYLQKLAETPTYSPQDPEVHSRGKERW